MDQFLRQKLDQKITLQHIYIYVCVVRFGSGPVWGELPVRFWPIF